MAVLYKFPDYTAGKEFFLDEGYWMKEDAEGADVLEWTIYMQGGAVQSVRKDAFLRLRPDGGLERIKNASVPVKRNQEHFEEEYAAMLKSA
jgi:hypothetical protein